MKALFAWIPAFARMTPGRIHVPGTCPWRIAQQHIVRSRARTSSSPTAIRGTRWRLIGDPDNWGSASALHPSIHPRRASYYTFAYISQMKALLAWIPACLRSISREAPLCGAFNNWIPHPSFSRLRARTARDDGRLAGLHAFSQPQKPCSRHTPLI